MISTETIELVKARTKITDVVGAFVKLKRKGVDHVGLCPFHNEKTPSFTVSPGKGIYKCFGCGKSGDAISFVMEHENKTYPEAIQFLAERVNVTLEEQPMKKSYTRPAPRLEKVSKKAIEWFKSRGISNDTLLRMKITEAIEWMPQFEKEVTVICFNYYRDGELVNIKFRGPQKSFKLAKDAELIFYNLDALKGEKTAVIVEGEIDCLTCVECGIYNSASVPNGAGMGNQKLEYLDNCYEFFEGIEKIILATDNDAPGRSLRDELARRLGVDRCYQVEYPEDSKDINEVKMKFGREAVIKVIDTAKQWPLRGLSLIDDNYDTVSDWYQNGYPTGAKTRIPGFDALLTFARGQLTIMTGIPGHGKDEFSNFIMTSLAKFEEWPWGIFGFEETPPETITKLQEKFTGKSFGFRRDITNRMSIDEFEWSIGMVDKYFKIVNPDEIETDIDSILQLATQLVLRFGIKGLYVNPWNWIEHSRPAHMSETEYISVALTKVIKWARKHGVHVLLLAHTTKIAKDKDGKFIVPNLYSISGSANFYNKTHNGVTVYRDFNRNVTDVYVQKVKQSWYGQTGWVSFTYDTMTRQYHFSSSSLVEAPQRDPPPELGNGSWKQLPPEKEDYSPEDDQPF